MRTEEEEEDRLRKEYPRQT